MSVRNKDRSTLRFEDFREVDATAKAGEKFKDFEYAWKNGGQRPDGGKMTIRDALAMWEAPLFIPKVINNAIQEAVEPMLIATKMLQPLPFMAGSQVIDIPVFGAVDGDFDVAEEESYPELRVAYGPGTEVSKMGKQGVAIRFTEEVLRYSHFDVVSMSVRQAVKALARNKEEKIFNMWYRVAECTHDNSAPLSSAYGTTTGRDITGAQNGTLTMDDIFEMYAQILHNGFTPDVLIMHPLTWLMFVQDAQLRSFAQMSQSPWFGSQWSGSPSKNDFPSVAGGESISGNVQRFHPSVKVGNPNGLAAADISPFSHNLESAPVLPNYLGIPFRIVVSSFVPYNAADNTTTILMADSAELGFYIEDEALGTTEWKDPETDITKIKLKERFTIREKNRGLGLAVAKNIVVASNQIILPAQSTISIDGSVSAATRNAAVV